MGVQNGAVTTEDGLAVYEKVNHTLIIRLPYDPVMKMYAHANLNMRIYSS